MSQTSFTQSVKGNCYQGGGVSWAEAQSRTTGSVNDGGANFVFLLDRGSTYCNTRRGYAIWDTSSLPDSCTISSAVFRAKTAAIGNPFGGNMELRVVTMASNTVVTDTDYNKANFGTLAGSLAMSSVASTGNSNDITLDASVISKTGYTKLGLIHSRDYANQDPGASAGYEELRLGDDNLMYLIITWTTVPAVTTGSATAITATTATLGGNITDAGGGTVSTAGVCWGTSANPTTANSKTSTATTSGAFTVGATGLISGVLYHYRAYVTTENSTQYGSDQTFRTTYGGNFIPFI